MIHEVSEFKACRRGSRKRRVGLRILLLSQLLCSLEPQMETLQQHQAPASPTPPSAQTRDTTLGYPGTLTFLRTNFPEPLKQSAVDFTSFAGNKRSGHPGTFSLAFLQTATTPHVFVSRELFSISLDNCKDNLWMLKLHLLLCCDTQLLSDYKLIPSRK